MQRRNDDDGPRWAVSMFMLVLLGSALVLVFVAGSRLS
jgi:hypothetical protein